MGRGAFYTNHYTNAGEKLTQRVLQRASFRPVYERYGEFLHHEGAFLLKGVVDQDADRGFSFLIRHIKSLRKVLANS